jgi:hypothetical protein
MSPTAFPQYLRRPQASQYLAEIWGLQFAPGTLAKMCALGTGPETHHCGRQALHTPQALDDFARGRIRPPQPRTSADRTPFEKKIR